jgi:hypothetical protein
MVFIRRPDLRAVSAEGQSSRIHFALGFDMERLSCEILSEIFSFIPARDVANVLRVCKDWRDVVRSLNFARQWGKRSGLLLKRIEEVDLVRFWKDVAAAEDGKWVLHPHQLQSLRLFCSWEQYPLLSVFHVYRYRHRITFAMTDCFRRGLWCVSFPNLGSLQREDYEDFETDEDFVASNVEYEIAEIREAIDPLASWAYIATGERGMDVQCFRADGSSVTNLAPLMMRSNTNCIPFLQQLREKPKVWHFESHRALRPGEEKKRPVDWMASMYEIPDVKNVGDNSITPFRRRRSDETTPFRQRQSDGRWMARRSPSYPLNLPADETQLAYLTIHLAMLRELSTTGTCFTRDLSACIDDDGALRITGPDLELTVANCP